MRIINREEFLKMPSGTLFSFGETHNINFSGLMVKYDTLINKENIRYDFIYQNLIAPVKAEDSNELMDTICRAIKTGENFELDFDCSERDGVFDESAIYAIYEKSEIEALINLLNTCI